MFFRFIFISVLIIFCSIHLSLADGWTDALNCELFSTDSPLYCQWNITSPDNWLLIKYNDTKKRHIQWDGIEHGPTIYGKFNQKVPIRYHGEFVVDAIELYSPHSEWSKKHTDLISPTIDANKQDVPYCYTFQYYIHGEGVGNLTLKYLQDNNEKTIWRGVGSAGDMWHNQKVLIEKPNKNFKLKFEATSQSGAISLASSKVYSYGCNWPDSFQCSFESNDCDDLLSISPNNSSEYKWEKVQAHTNSNGSKRDHTTESQHGHYLQAQRGNSGDYTDLITKSFKARHLPRIQDIYCLNFWYRIQDNTEDSLFVIVQDETMPDKGQIVWKSRREFPSKEWQNAKVQIYIQDDDNNAKQIVFRANTTGKSSSVQIDDIKLNGEFSCNTQVNCDFDEDMCSWTRDLDHEFKWEHGIGRVTNAQVLPDNVTIAPLDVTEGHQTGGIYKQGMYMYTDFTKKVDKEKSTVVMYSEFIERELPLKTKMYFSYIPLVFNDPKNRLTVSLLDVEGKIISTLLTIGAKESTSRWNETSVEIPVMKLFRIAFQVETYSPQTYLAIDNILFSY